jgi:ABC-type multidrug transport system fused ATPase/permease subunit
VFENFSLNIKWNQVTAFVWESWGWKTTLMKLISAFIEQNTWEIIIDWQNLREINLMSYYQEIWYLTQEPNVFDWTILENLTYWSKEKITEAKLKKAIKNAKCEFIYDFKNWLNTEIWERWVRLSWWQKQRLAIAKIFLKDPKIIFLDEPTSALDSQSEKLIHESFKELFKWKTVIIIAHRLQTVKSADEIFVIEKWNHESLLKKKSYYYNMIELQSGF